MAQYAHTQQHQSDLKWTFQILKTVDERVTAFANYMVDTYVDDGALYPPQLWALEPDADEDDVPRTTNAAEAFHMHMKDLFNSPRPNLYLFAFKLLQLQEETYHYVCQPAESALLAQAGEINWREQTMCLTSVNSTNTCNCHGWNMSDLWLSNICQLIARTGRTPTAECECR